MSTKGKFLSAVAVTFSLSTTVVFAGTTELGTATAFITQGQSVNANVISQAAIHKLTKHDSKPAYTIVRAGQSLWSISQLYGVSVSSLERWNHLSNKSIIHIGQHLIVGFGSSVNAPSSREGSVNSNVAAATEGLDAVYYAEKFLGAPYVWGGSYPSGFDCSGFTMFVFRHFGVSLPHTSYGQFNLGNSVSRNNLEIGDLVFFSTAGWGASHVGIYVGNGRFISASGSSIRLSTLSDGYWASNYVGARRIL